MIETRSKTRRFGTLLITLAMMLALGLILAARAPFISNVSAQSPLTSVIIQLAGDPVVVARARAQAAGQGFNADAYRQQVINEQRQFLARLAAAGVTDAGSITIKEER